MGCARQIDECPEIRIDRHENARFRCGCPQQNCIAGQNSKRIPWLDACLGIAGWQWVFLAEGLPTLALAALCPFVLRAGPADAARLARPEREWLEIGLQAERDAAIGRHLPMRRAIISPQLVLLTIVELLVGFGVYGKGFSCR